MSDNVVFDDSVVTLKKTIPLMMKYNVPVLPQNYALWYTYASNAIPELNQEIDSVLASHAPFSDFHAESIYDKHMKSEDTENACKINQSVENLASSISESIGFTKDGAEKFEQAMDTCHEQLNGIDSNAVESEQISSFVGDLISKSLQMRDNAKDFGQSLNSAIAEISLLREKLENSRKEALVDELTGALNRRAFNDAMNDIIASGATDSCLIIADIDHFKKFNDTHGHLLGDQVLKVVAGRLASTGDIAASAYRFGGEEFAILVPRGGIALASRLAEHLRKSIEKLVIKDKKSQKKIAKITCSFGVAQFTPGCTVFSLIELADSRLYQAKKGGRNRVVFG